MVDVDEHCCHDHQLPGPVSLYMGSLLQPHLGQLGTGTLHTFSFIDLRKLSTSHDTADPWQTPLYVFLMVLSLLGDRHMVPESLAFSIVLDILHEPSLRHFLPHPLPESCAVS